MKCNYVEVSKKITYLRPLQLSESCDFAVYPVNGLDELQGNDEHVIHLCMLRDKKRGNKFCLIFLREPGTRYVILQDYKPSLRVIILSV